MPTLDELLVKIDASTELLRREMKKGDNAVAGFQRRTDQRLGKVEAVFGRVGRAAKASIAGLAAGLTVSGLSRFTREAITMADSIAKAARTADFAGERFQRLQFAFEEGGVTQREYDAGMQRLNRRLGLFIQNGGGPAAQAIKDLGLETQIAAGKVDTAEALFDLLVKRLEGVKNEAEAAAIASAFFGDEAGPKFVQTLRLGAKGLKEVEDRAAGVLSDQQLERAEQLNDTFAEMAKTVGGALKGAFIDATAAVLEFFNAPRFVTKAGELDAQIERLEKKIRNLKGELDSPLNRAAFFGGSGRVPSQIQADIDAAEVLLAEFQRRRRALTADEAGITEVQVNARRRALPSRLPESAPDVDLLDFDRLIEARKQVEDLEISVLQSQGRVAEAINMQADQQIWQWQRVAEETPLLAEEAQAAILAINQRAIEDIRRLSEKSEPELDKAKERAQALGDAMAATFESRGIDALLSGKISDAIKGFARDIAELTLRMAVLQPLAEGIFGGGFGGGLARLFGGGRARGGRVSPGRFNVVGEEGPELFVPDVPGRILNAAQVGRRMSAGAPSITQEINIPLAFPPQLEAFVRNIAGPAGRDAALQVLSAQQGRI